MELTEQEKNIAWQAYLTLPEWGETGGDGFRYKTLSSHRVFAAIEAVLESRAAGRKAANYVSAPHNGCHSCDSDQWQCPNCGALLVEKPESTQEPLTGEPTAWAAQDHLWEYEKQGVIKPDVVRDREICPTCQASRWEHSKEQWDYCHLPDKALAELNNGEKAALWEHFLRLEATAKYDRDSLLFEVVNSLLSYRRARLTQEPPLRVDNTDAYEERLDAERSDANHPMSGTMQDEVRVTDRPEPPIQPQIEPSENLTFCPACRGGSHHLCAGGVCSCVHAETVEHLKIDPEPPSQQEAVQFAEKDNPPRCQHGVIVDRPCEACDAAQPSSTDDVVHRMRKAYNATGPWSVLVTTREGMIAALAVAREGCYPWEQIEKAATNAAAGRSIILPLRSFLNDFRARLDAIEPAAQVTE